MTFAVRRAFRAMSIVASLVMLFAVAQPSHAADKAAVKGQFKVLYQKIKDPGYAKLQKDLQDDKVLEGIAADLNDTFNLPSDITLTFSECGEPNAFYDPEKKRIEICYDLLEDFYKTFGKEIKDEDKLDDAVINATIFTFYHELGHALIDVLDLPVTGKEEDAVDQLSTVVLADGTKDGEQAAIDGARSFYLASKDAGNDLDKSDFADEHSLDQQRYYNILCWVYGEHPDAHQDLVKSGILPEERADRCEDEWTRIEKSWTTLLAPHVKDDGKGG